MCISALLILFLILYIDEPVSGEVDNVTIIIYIIIILCSLYIIYSFIIALVDIPIWLFYKIPNDYGNINESPPFFEEWEECPSYFPKF